MPNVALLTAWIDGRGGVAHTSDLRAAGFTDHSIRSAVAGGAVRRIRRSWIVTKAASPMVVAAVATRGRLTCLSEARRLDLWTPPHEGLHISVPSSSSEPVRSGIVFHHSRGPMPVARRDVREPVVNVLAHISTCVARENALVVWESAVRHGLVLADHLARIPWSGPRARELASAASELADSGLETIVTSRLRPFGLRVRQQVWLDGHQVDLLIGEKLIVQLDGFAHHSDAKDRRRDIAHDARLQLRGYTVLRFDYAQVMFGWNEVEHTILMAVAQGCHGAG